MAAALQSGQTGIDVHIFPFRFEKPPLADWQRQPWGSFWANLREGYDAFAHTGLPPTITVAKQRYQVRERAAAQTAAAP